MSDLAGQIFWGFIGIAAGAVLLLAMLMLPDIIRHGWRNDR